MIEKIRIIKACRYKRQLWSHKPFYFFEIPSPENKLIFKRHVDSKDSTDGSRYASAYIPR